MADFLDRFREVWMYRRRMLEYSFVVVTDWWGPKSQSRNRPQVWGSFNADGRQPAYIMIFLVDFEGMFIFWCRVPTSCRLRADRRMMCKCAPLGLIRAAWSVKYVLPQKSQLNAVKGNKTAVGMWERPFYTLI